ncbi:uncharacterized protein EV154DRAFT_555624 [Mucor mucedo]|uniref:uncharacterized protein n=1 Tax=Mucor mucedo TaxID=29922 RepID=UPI00221EC39C|nr:uncharacterized protein EV154DRAFT_555624 [Mucor mucedo]KAI7877090.1 hypothetical protein EV154DRAFT_555624 [Mucor mucedo]
MRAFSILATIATLALSANAASHNKRAISDNVQSCINGLTSADAKLLELKTAVDGFTSAAGYPGATAIHSTEQALEALLKTTNTACCATTTTVTDEEAAAVFGLVGNIVPDITGSLDSIIAKKPDFAAVAFATAIVKTDVKALAGLLKTLDGCLIAVTPEALLESAQAYVATIDAKFATAFSTYGITA